MRQCPWPSQCHCWRHQSTAVLQCYHWPYERPSSRLPLLCLQATSFGLRYR
ncbi:hypothetical protein F2Q70_00032896 [Brassica cretica]|uniref:Uncharacterized protein n=1 Tax=Brassica cretica TaxID=69181 RepID=A0A8S9MZW7_BRACR|nr:hypothetical protein F2Q70_00032896 [Brassica cretica]KAF3487258.1 hypothetical protein F2Q69_00057206 [Brassica cretica]